MRLREQGSAIARGLALLVDLVLALVLVPMVVFVVGGLLGGVLGGAELALLWLVAGAVIVYRARRRSRPAA